jgi:hypothetical protein
VLFGSWIIWIFVKLLIELASLSHC